MVRNYINFVTASIKEALVEVIADTKELQKKSPALRVKQLQNKSVARSVKATIDETLAILTSDKKVLKIFAEAELNGKEEVKDALKDFIKELVKDVKLLDVYNQAKEG